MSEANASAIVEQVDLVVDCAPLFAERFAMNRAAVTQRKPIVECAMFELEAQITTVLPGQTACLACLYPEEPAGWKREFPVFGGRLRLAGLHSGNGSNQAARRAGRSAA